MVESWVEMMEKRGRDKKKADMSLEVSSTEYKKTIVINRGPNNDWMQIMHPNDAVRVTGKYSAVLVLPTQFMPVVECWAARKKMLNLEAPGKTLSERKYVLSAAGCWSPLVIIHLRNTLVSALAGQTVWSSPEVDRELKLLFSMGDERAFNNHIQTVCKSLWEDIY